MTPTLSESPPRVESANRRERVENLFDRLERHSRSIGLGLLLVAMVMAVGLLVWALRNTVFGTDEWSLMFNAQSDSISEIFDPWNGHLLAVGRLLAHLSLSVAGSSIWFLTALDIAGALVCSALVYVFARRRIGPILALIPGVIPLFFSGASTFYGAGIQFAPLFGVNAIFALNFGLAALLLIENNRRRDDIAACTMLCLSLATFSYGIAFLAGTAVAILLGPERWRRAFVVAIPFVLYGAWRVWASKRGGTAGEVGAENVLLIPLYFSDSISAVGSGLFGLTPIVGRGPAVSFVLQHQSLGSISLPLFLIVVEVLLITLIARALGTRGFKRVSLWPPLATLIALWSLQGLVVDIASRMPGDPRYLFAGAVLVGIVLAEIARGIRLSRWGVAAALAVTAAGVIANMPRFHEAKMLVDHETNVSRVSGTMIDLAGPNGDQSLVVARDLPGVSKAMWIGAGDYREFTRRYGSLDMPLDQLQSADGWLRVDADRILLRSLRLGLTPTPAQSAGSCVSVAAGGEVAFDPGVAELRSKDGAAIAIRRFGDRSLPLGRIPAGGLRRLAIPADRAARIPWMLTSEGGGFVVCEARRTGPLGSIRG